MRTSAVAIVVLLVVAAQAVFADEGTISTHVQDLAGRPVPGVVLTFSGGACTTPFGGEGFAPTVIEFRPQTDEGGNCRVRYFCAGSGARLLRLTVTATANGVSDSETVSGDQNPTVAITLDLSRVDVSIRDQKGRPYPNVYVALSSSGGVTQSVRTENTGDVIFPFVPASVPALVSAGIGDAQNQTSITPRRDERLNLTLPSCDLTVSAIKDDGAPLQGAVVSVTGPASYSEMKNTDASGAASFTMIPPGQAAVSLRFGNFNASKAATLSSDSEVALVMDVNAPVVSNVSYTAPKPGTQINVTARVEDMGTNASGVARAAMYYSSDGGTNWRQVPMSAGAGVYGASVPPQANNTNVSVKIETFDNAGNGANSSETLFTVSEEARGTEAPSRGGGACGSAFILAGLAAALFATRR